METRLFTYLHHNSNIAVIVELQATTDFALKTDEITRLGNDLALQIAAMAPESYAEFMRQIFVKTNELTIARMIEETREKLKEPLEVTRFIRIEGGQACEIRSRA